MIKRKIVTPWDAQKDALISRLWIDGDSSTQIAACLGAPFTRNAVIGRLSRLNVPKRNPPRELIKRPPRVPKSIGIPNGLVRLVRTSATETERTAYDAAPALDANGKPYNIATIPHGRCQWIAGDPSATAPMCGHPGKPYCAHHAARAYTPQQPRSHHARAA